MIRRAAAVAAGSLGLLAVLLAGCTEAPPLEPAAATAASASPSEPTPSSGAPSGTIRVGYPDVVRDWSGRDVTDTAAVDLFSLWGLPLYRYDDAGQLVPVLAAAASYPEVPEGWAVDVDLAAGEWSDGTPVTSADVVATAAALGDARPDEWATLTGVTALDPDTVRLSFSEPNGRWAHLLSAPPGVLPAEVLADGGLDTYREGPPVSGGPFRLVDTEPGRSMVFEAHAAGPAGPPAAARLEIDVVPSYEVALGLLDRGEVDVVLGHLAINAVDRATRLDGVQAGAPIGGTTVLLQWWPDGDLADDPDLRVTFVDAVDLGELVEGLLGDEGTPATSPVPGVEGPFRLAIGRPAVRSGLEDTEVVLTLPRWQEAPAFTARAIQRDVIVAGGELRLVSVETPNPLDIHDGSLVVRRDPPRPFVPGGEAVPPAPDGELAVALAPAFEALEQDAMAVPLYRIGVAHAWRGVERVEPSSWPGLAFSGAASWRLADPAR